jgi:hypothetical protein
MEKVTAFDGELRARAPLELQRAVEREAAKRLTSPSEILRWCVIEALDVTAGDGGEGEDEATNQP